MTLATWLSRALEAALVITIAALLLSSFLGYPVLLGYVETDSMRPALDSNDGFVSVPAPLAGDIESGDVVVFRAEVLHDGGLVTHRVVRETENGFVTKGDGNPVTDQSGSGEPPVRREQIVAEALQANGDVVAIPWLGGLVTAIRSTLSEVQLRLAGLFRTRVFLGNQGLAILLALLFTVFYLVNELRARAGPSSRRYERSSSRSNGSSARFTLALLTLFLVGSVTIGMVGSWQTHELQTISDDTETANVSVRNTAFAPTTVFFEPGSNGVSVRPDELSLSPRTTDSASVVIPPPTGIDDMRRYLTEHRYFSVLPQSLTRDLYRFHPWAPVVVIDAVIGIPFYLAGAVLVGGGRLRVRSRTRDKRAIARLRRLLRSDE